MAVIADPKLRAQLTDLLAEGERRVDQLKAELVAAQGEVDALRQLLGTPRQVLSGDSLRAELVRLLKEHDREQNGVHYQDLTKMLRDRGFEIGGKSADKAPNVRAHLSHGPEAERLFAPVGKNKGRYTWR
jgi:hypothetical protein